MDVYSIMTQPARYSQVEPLGPAPHRPIFIPITRADALFTQLDHQLLANGEERWITEVVGIHSTEQGIWIQIGFVDRPETTAVVHLSRHSTADHALAALGAWVKQPADKRSTIIQAMQVA